MSKKPQRLRIRPGASTSAVLRGEVDVSEWDNEELIRGRRRGRDGTFRGRAPSIIPRELFDELRRRTMTEVHEEVRRAALPAAALLGQMVRGEVEPDPTQLRAVQEVLDRFIGKAPQHVEIDVAVKPWEEALAGGVVRDIEMQPGDDDRTYEDAVLDVEAVER